MSEKECLKGVCILKIFSIAFSDEALTSEHTTRKQTNCGIRN
jgi:hypothetical protein